VQTCFETRRYEVYFTTAVIIVARAELDLPLRSITFVQLQCERKRAPSFPHNRIHAYYPRFTLTQLNLFGFDCLFDRWRILCLAYIV
jgi:hypothetical protein